MKAIKCGRMNDIDINTPQQGLLYTYPLVLKPTDIRAGGHKKRISNRVPFNPAFAKRYKKQTMIDIREISTNWFKNHLYHSIRFQDCGLN